MSFNTEVGFNHTLPEFKELSKLNPDGWGLSVYPDGQCTIEKDSLSMMKSPKALNLIARSDLKSKLLLAHVRNKNNSIINDENCHPFHCEYQNKTYSYVHNCYLINNMRKDYIIANRITPRHFHPISTNQAEKIFCYIMDELKENQIIDWNHDSFEFLNQTFNNINNNRLLNAIMSEGEYLFVYLSDLGYGIYAVQRNINTKEIKMNKTKTTHHFDSSFDHEEGWLFCTSKLTDENWIQLENAKLHVYKDGQKVY